ncbi:MAG TPA: hypothetical protein VH682_31765 [Gemmataceae bacterium]|jgi:hypothetical protein
MPVVKPSVNEHKKDSPNIVLRDAPQLTDPSAQLIGKITADIRAMGLVGEEDKALLMYLAYSSRKLNKPLSVIIKGPSGSGKDEIQRRPADLMPPEDVKDFMSITPQALYYGEPGWLEHKIILGGERKHEDSEEQRDKTAAIRQMLSHGYITKSTVVDGLKGREIRQDGPVSYSETTTKDSIFQEDANRCLQINTSADVELTRRILKAQSANYMPGQDSAQERKEIIRREHHIFQQRLQCVAVRIPYAEILADKVPTGQIEIRRIFGQMLSLIGVIAWIHQFQRVPNTYGQLEATLDDYRLARRLALGSLHLAIGLGKDYEKCKAIENKLPKGKPFTTTEAAQALGDKSRKVTLDALAKLQEAGVIHCFVKGQGNRPATWRWTGVSVDELILPGVETVEAALRE